MLSDFKSMQCVHYMNRIDIHVDMKKLTLQYKHLSICDNPLSGEKNGNPRLRDPGFKIRDRDLRVFINSEPETLLLKTSEPRDSNRQKFATMQISKAN